MGNCIFKGYGVVEEMVKVVTPNGGLMELYAPITAECITNEFPGYGIYCTPQSHHISPPLLRHEKLCAGQYYYLLPLHSQPHNKSNTSIHRENNSNNNTATNHCAAEKPYRMSVDNYQGMLNKNKRLSAEGEILPRYNSIGTAGVWKVRLVINTDQLWEILSQEACTEALIENVRTVAKCAGAARVDSWATATENSATDAIYI